MDIATKEWFYPSANGEHPIHALAWHTQDSTQTKAVLQIAHGMAEYAGRYHEFAHYMAQQGIAVYANDHAGHGQSLNKDGLQGYFGKSGSRYTLIEDMLSLTEQAQEVYPGVPYFILGHSMGSFLARLYTAKYKVGLQGAIFMGTGNGSPLLDVAIALSKQLAHLRGNKAEGRIVDRLSFANFNKNVKNPQTSHDWLSANPANVQQYLADPHCGFVFTYSAFYQLFSLIKEIITPEWAQQLCPDMPVLLIAGKDDPVGNYGKDVEAVAQLLEVNGIKDITLKLYEGLRHEILNENEKLEVYHYICRWIYKHLPATALGSGCCSYTKG